MIAAVLLVLGGVFMLLAAVGLLRLPDLFLRLSATSKASTLGAALCLLGAGVHFGGLDVLARLTVTVAFLFLTAPVAAHMIGRAGYHRGCRLWEGTATNQAEGQLPRRRADRDREPKE